MLKLESQSKGYIHRRQRFASKSPVKWAKGRHSASERLVRSFTLGSGLAWASNLVGANFALKVRGRGGAATGDLYVRLPLASPRPQPFLRV